MCLDIDMPRPLSLSQRTSILSALADGMSLRKLAKKSGVSLASIKRLKAKYVAGMAIEDKMTPRGAALMKRDAMHEAIAAIISENRKQSVSQIRHRLAQQGLDGFSWSSVYRAMKDLHTPLKQVKCHVISATAKGKRAAWASRMIGRLALGCRIRPRVRGKAPTGLRLDQLVWEDECYFVLDDVGVGNVQNTRVWMPKGTRKREILAGGEPSALHKTHSQSGSRTGVMVIGVMSSTSPAPSLFFCPRGLKMDTNAWLGMLSESIILAAHHLCPDYHLIIDGAPSHTSHTSKRFYQEVLGGRVSIQAPSSPDMSPLDWCLWGLLKAELSQGERATTLLQLRTRIVAAYAKILVEKKEVFEVVGKEFVRRIRVLQMNAGGWVEFDPAVKEKPVADEEEEIE